MVNSSGNSSALSIQEKLIESLYISLTDLPRREIWKSFLDVARDAFSCDHASLILLPTPSPGDQPVIFCDDASSEPAIEAACRSGFFNFPHSDHIIERECDFSSAENPVFRRALIAPITNERSREIYLALWRVRPEPFGENERALLNQLLNHLKIATKVFFQIADFGRNMFVLNNAIDTVDVGIILADVDGNIVFSNSIADEILSTDDGLKQSCGKLYSNSAAETAKLLEQIRRQAAAQDARSYQRVYDSLGLQRRNSALPITIIFRPGPVYRPQKYPILRTAMLVLRDPNRRLPFPPAILARVFGLTRCESLLASELARGASVEEAALHLGIKLNTARSQLRAVFVKTGAKRQGELVRLVHSSAAAMSAVN